jgi:hypothetical protein
MAAKEEPRKKADLASSQKINKGDAYLCEICGLQVHVDLCGEFLTSKDLSCCGHSMKKKT